MEDITINKHYDSGMLCFMVDGPVPITINDFVYEPGITIIDCEKNKDKVCKYLKSREGEKYDSLKENGIRCVHYSPSVRFVHLYC